VTLQLLWEEHRSVHPDGYGYSHCCELYRAWAVRLSPTKRFTDEEALAQGILLKNKTADAANAVFDRRIGTPSLRKGEIFHASSME